MNGLTRERALALAGLAGLLLVGLVTLLLIVGAASGEDEQSAQLPPSRPTATPKPKPTTTPKPTPTPLSAEQKLERSAAADQMRNQGFEPVSLKTWKPELTLRVLIGRPAGGEQGGKRAFFFVGEQLVGTDSPNPTQRLKVYRNTMTQVILRYTLYESGNKPCCPKGGTADVRFKWDGASLVTRDPVPPPSARIAVTSTPG